MTRQVFREAEARDLHNVYTFVRVDNKVGFHLARKFGMAEKVAAGRGSDPSLVLVERILHKRERDTARHV